VYDLDLVIYVIWWNGMNQYEVNFSPSVDGLLKPDLEPSHQPRASTSVQPRIQAGTSSQLQDKYSVITPSR
jgi:hypothetical protein